MKETAERKIYVGLKRKPKKVFDEVEKITASMKKEGWTLTNNFFEESLGYLHLFFEREIETQ